VLLAVPEDLRERAVQLVLHPSFDERPLGPAEARRCVDELVIRPARSKGLWEAGKVKLGEAWGKRLRKAVRKGLKDGVVAVVCEWDEREIRARGTVAAEEKVPLALCAPDAPEGVLWAEVAARHSLPVWVVPTGDDAERPQAVVNLALAKEGESVSGEGAWLATGPKKGRDAAVVKAEMNLDDPGHDAAEERPETVIEQTVEYVAAIDMGAVRKVAMWAVSSDADPMDAPEFVPEWARKLGMEGMWTELDGVCNWVMGLRRGNAALSRPESLEGAIQ
jgi:hypothetical protein